MADKTNTFLLSLALCTVGIVLIVLIIGWINGPVAPKAFKPNVPKNSANRAEDGSKQEVYHNRLVRLANVLSMLQGLAYPFLKVALIALSSKALREAINQSVSNAALIQEINDIYDSIQTSNKTTHLFLMGNLDFHQSMFVTALFVLVLAATQPLQHSLIEYYITPHEIKRLQRILYERFILQPNSVPIEEANDLLYTKLFVVDKFWKRSKFYLVYELFSASVCAVLLIVLAWDLGLMVIGSMGLMMILNQCIWSRMSVPWAEQREQAVSETNALLVDLVICKEGVLTNAQETTEFANLLKTFEADKQCNRKLFDAKTLTYTIRGAAFFSLTPALFLFVYETNLTVSRVFELLLVIVIQDELLRNFQLYSNDMTIHEEYARAQRNFAKVLDTPVDDIFPSDSFFSWFCCSKKSADKQQSHGLCVGYGTDDQSSSQTTSPELQKPNQGKKDVDHHQNSQICFKNLSCGYKVSDEDVREVVKSMNYTFEIGKHYAIMGETGCGKSTALKTLSGLLPSLGGQIYANNEAPIMTTSASWRKQLAVVTQDSVFLNRTLRENLVYGSEQEPPSDYDILTALEMVNLKEWCLNLPDGLDTLVCTNGKEFSGGQRQRLQIANLLLNPRPLVIMDEFTSALDIATTTSVLSILQDFLEDKTLIMITHDLQPLQLVDTVLEMQPNGGALRDVTSDYNLQQCQGNTNAQNPSTVDVRHSMLIKMQ